MHRLHAMCDAHGDECAHVLHMGVSPLCRASSVRNAGIRRAQRERHVRMPATICLPAPMPALEGTGAGKSGQHQQGQMTPEGEADKGHAQPCTSLTSISAASPSDGAPGPSTGGVAIGTAANSCSISNGRSSCYSLRLQVCKQLPAAERRGLPADALMLSAVAEGNAHHVAAVMQLLADVHWLDTQALAWAVIKLAAPPGRAPGCGQSMPSSAPVAGGTNDDDGQGDDAGASAAAGDEDEGDAWIEGAQQGKRAPRPADALLLRYWRAFRAQTLLGLGVAMEVSPRSLVFAPTVTGFRRRLPHE